MSEPGNCELPTVDWISHLFCFEMKLSFRVVFLAETQWAIPLYYNLWDIYNVTLIGSS